MKALPVGKPLSYIPKCDRQLSQSDQTIFQVKKVSALQLAQLQDDIYEVKSRGRGERSEVFKSGTYMYKILVDSLVGWENFKDEEGKDVIFVKTRDGKCDPANLDYILPEVRTELFNFATGAEEIGD